MTTTNPGYLAVLAKYPDFHRRGAQASNRQQLTTHGVLVGYRAQRGAAYQACVQRHGVAVARAALRRAHAARRQQRLEAPTAGERKLREALETLGYSLEVDPQIVYDQHTALLEAPLDRFYADALIPWAHLVVEVYGGVHVLQVDYDRWRRQLEALGYHVLELPDTLTCADMCAAIRAAVLRIEEESRCFDD